MTQRTSLSDQPFVENVNDFGTERYVNGLIRFIENSSAPLTIALQGEWGSGKTSLMTRLERALCLSPDSRFIGIDVNTWEYSILSSPEATVYRILVQLINELTNGDLNSKNTLRKFLRGAGNFLYRGARESLKTIPGVGGMLAVGLEAANVPTQLSENSDDNAVSLSDLKKALADAVQKTITEAKKQGVIVFVDDLDRLNPSVAVEILELLKNIFTLDNCIFILAIDYDVVVKGLKPKFGELNDKNEREFRSFFDKIIQVPFSLPVNNYRPMNFVLKSLVDIGYINGFDSSSPKVKSLLSSIVEASVGKNPRSIKRLINTISLLECIAQCGTETDGSTSSDSLDDKFLNFIIVSIQICYPKIYRMLSCNPGFSSWDEEFARKMGIQMEFVDDEESSQQWEEVLEAACKPDPYLFQHLDDITRLLNMVIEILGFTNQADQQQLGRKMKEIIDKSSITGINSEFKLEDTEKKELMQKLHKNVLERLHAKRPDIKKCKLKRNTGNGGMYITVDNMVYDVTFSPTVSSDNKVALRLRLDLQVKRPQRLCNMTFEELMQDSVIAKSIAGLDKTLSPLLNDSWFFKGQTYDGKNSCFKNYTDELRYLHNKGEMSETITNKPEYLIELDKISYFENDNIVDAITDVLIASYDFHKSMKDFK